MAKRVLGDDGHYYRKRRGKLVKIPAEWLHNVTHPQTMRKRKTKAKMKRLLREKMPQSQKQRDSTAFEIEGFYHE